MWNLENSEQGSHSEAATIRTGVLEIFMDKSAWNRVSKNNRQSSALALGKLAGAGQGNKRPGGRSATWRMQGGGVTGSSHVLCS